MHPVRLKPCPQPFGLSVRYALCWVVGIFGLAGMVQAQSITVTGSANGETITSVTYIDDGNLVVQNSSSGADDNDSEPVLVEFVDITRNGGTRLDEFNTGVVTAVTLNFIASSGFNAYVGNQTINSSSPNFAAAVRAVYSNRDIRDYMDKASSANSNNPNGDYDIFYQFALSNDDYIVMAERDGNSTISIQALDANGNRLPGSNEIIFQGGGNSAFQWDTGYRSGQDGNNGQTQELAVIDISLFNTNDNIFGLRVINNSGADNKILVASDDEFENNVPNPAGSALPIFTVLKTAQVANGSDPDFYLPGTDVIYTVTVTNSGLGSPDLGSFTFTDDLPDAVELFVGNFQGAGGPINFTEGSEPSDLDFSQVNVVYRNASGSAISPGSSGYNPNITSFEINFPAPDTFDGYDGTGPQPSFTVSYRVRIKE